MRNQKSLVILAASLLAGCARSQHQSNAHQVSCLPDGANADSAFLAQKALGALDHHTSVAPLRVETFQPININQIEMGVLISVVISDASQVGGGGLVWVDVETACPIVLKEYE